MIDVYDTVTYVDRAAAHAHDPLNFVANKVIARVALEHTSEDFWSPIRSSILMKLKPSALYSGTVTKPVITYISRQGAAKRKLKQSDHLNLVRELKSLEDECEVHVVEMETLNFSEQLHLASRTNILIGQSYLNR